MSSYPHTIAAVLEVIIVALLLNYWRKEKP